MKPSLRNAYFGWLAAVILLAYLLFLVVLLIFNAHEAAEHGYNSEEESEELLALVSMMALTIPVVVVAAWVIAGRLLQPLSRMLTAAERIRSGKLDERIPPLPHRDELSRLGDTINDAFDRYAAAVQRLDRFSADAAHQLRTPLAVIRSGAEIALQQERSGEHYRDTLGAVLEQTERLNGAITRLLLLARLDRSLRAAFVAVEIDPWLRGWLEETAPLTEDRVVDYSVAETARPARITGDPVLLREVFNNLLDNAVAHTRPGGRIRLTLSGPAEGAVHITLEDDGPGIAEADRERVFERFARGAASSYPGSGLGLSLVREIVRLHGGEATAGQSASLGGALLSVRLPLA